MNVTTRRLEGRVIMVTGGGHGIGRAYCRRFAGEGAMVGIVDIDGEAAEAVAGEIGAAGGQAKALRGDVTRYESLSSSVASIESSFGVPITGLVNNAGMLTIRAISRVGFEEIDEREWDEVLETNLKGTWLACRAVVPSMRRAGSGSILNIGSSTYFLGSATRAHYVASKGAVIGFSRTLSRELGPDNIRVNTLVPGSTLSETDPSEDVLAMRSAPLAARSIKRIEMPEDLVGAAAFFMSDDSSYVTGQTLVVEGGGVLH